MLPVLICVHYVKMKGNQLGWNLLNRCFWYVKDVLAPLRQDLMVKGYFTTGSAKRYDCINA